MFIRRPRGKGFAVVFGLTLIGQLLLFVKLSSNVRDEKEGGDTEAISQSEERGRGDSVQWKGSSASVNVNGNNNLPGQILRSPKKWSSLNSHGGSWSNDKQGSDLQFNDSETYLARVNQKIINIQDQFKRLKELESRLFTDAIGPESDSQCILPNLKEPIDLCLRDVKWKCNLADTFSKFDRNTSTIHIECPGAVRVNFIERTESDTKLPNGHYHQVPEWNYMEGPTSVSMKSTYADVVCKDSRKSDVHNYHTQFIENKEINSKQLPKYRKTKKKEPHWKPLSVLVLTLDSLSRAHAHRKCGLPETMKLLKELYLGQIPGESRSGNVDNQTKASHQAFLFNRVNALSDSTILNLTPMFSGEHYQDLNSDKVKMAMYAKEIKEWIWQYAAKRGYLTMYGIDNSSGMMGTRTPCKECHYRPPTLPHVEHGWVKLENKEVAPNTLAGFCDGNHMLHEYLFNYTKEFLQQKYPAKWAAMDLNAGHRAEEISVNQVDYDLVQFIRTVTQDNPNLIVIILGDHGKPYKSNPSHIGGHYESYLPFLSLLLPSWIIYESPTILETLITNQQRYIVHADLHKTMKSLLHYPYIDDIGGTLAPQSKNLLSNVISRSRSCEEAGLPSWSCVCGTMRKLESSEWGSKHFSMTDIAIEYINNKHKQKQTQTAIQQQNTRSSCLELHLHKILHIFVNSNPSPNTRWNELYQITFQTVEKATTWQAVIDDQHDIKRVKQLSLYQRFEVCQDKDVALQYCVCDHPTLNA